MSSTHKPLLVVLTPVLNEAWILPAFLKATSLWADYIIIADQMSTDGSRELYDAFRKEVNINITPSNPNKHQCQLIVIDNPRKEMHQAATRRLLFEEAKKIEGDKLLFALDADEFLSGNFPETEGWRTIMNSEPGDVFCFRWMNLVPDGSKYSLTEPLYWAAHVNDEVMNGTFPDNAIHEWRLPWPKHENHVYTIEDIRFIHFGGVNKVRVKNKGLFYQVSQITQSNKKQSGISMYRQYHDVKYTTNYKPMPNGAYEFYENNGLDILSNIDLTAEGPHHVQTIKNKLQEYGSSFFRKLDIWDEDFLLKYEVKDPRRPIDKLMHWYLRKTNKWQKSLPIRAIDKMLKKLY